MHKKTRFLVLIVFIMTAFVLFGRNTTYKDVPLSEIETKVMTKADSSKFKKADSKSLKRYIGLNEKDYSEVVYLMPSSTMEVSELLIVKVKNKAQADAIESAGYSKATKARLDSTKLKNLGWTAKYDIQTGIIRTLSMLKTINSN